MTQRIMTVIFAVFVWATLAVAEPVTTVDLLATRHLELNAAGPLLVRVDTPRNRIILVNTNSSAVSLIDGSDHSVRNVAVAGRVPQYLKDEALAINPANGHVFIVGEHALYVIHPESGTALSIPTPSQYEMVAVNPDSDTAYLVGRESPTIAIVDPASGTLRQVTWAEAGSPAANLNQTPPPPLRKVVYDRELHTVIAVDGTTATLHLFRDTDLGEHRSRPLELPSGGRWHFAGYDPTNHQLYLVIETDRRRVVAAARIDISGDRDFIVGLPGLTEAVGIMWNPDRDEVYIPYDNHPTVQVVDFAHAGTVTNVAVPAYGNDATAVDPAGQRLFVANWAYAEIEVIDLRTRRLIRRLRHTGILPHMFSMDFNATDGQLYIPLGATAVNGSFGAAVTAMEPDDGHTVPIVTGWAPVSLVPIPGQDSVMVFGAQNGYAVIRPDGSLTPGTLPCPYPHRAVVMPDGDICVAYGAHQSWWPVMYIRGARNGILRIHPGDMSFYDRRLPRLAQDIAVDRTGALYALQNNWGKEAPFLAELPDGIREFEPGQRIELPDEVVRETSQRILRYDAELNRLVVVRTGETDDQPGRLHIVDVATRKTLVSLDTGRTPTDLVHDRKYLYIANFDSGTVTIVDRTNFSRREIPIGQEPLSLAVLGDRLYAIDHRGKTLEAVDPTTLARTSFPLPGTGRPDSLRLWGDRLVITTHSPDRLNILEFDPATGHFRPLHTLAYPFGDTAFDTGNASFFMRGQFSDVIYTLNPSCVDSTGRLWLADTLAGKVFILEKENSGK